MVLFYIWSAGDMVFSVKNIVQCGDELNHKTALKFSQKYHYRPKFMSENILNRAFLCYFMRVFDPLYSQLLHINITQIIRCDNRAGAGSTRGRN